MSHSKKVKRGESLYVEHWNPSAKRFINTCRLCGARGYSPTILDEGFLYDRAGNADGVHAAIYASLTATLQPLALSEDGICLACARVLEEKK